MAKKKPVRPPKPKDTTGIHGNTGKKRKGTKGTSKRWAPGNMPGKKRRNNK